MDSVTPDIKTNYEICEDNHDVFTLPIIRADDKVYLEELQRGELFMRNALYYQDDEEKDSRNDPYDSAVPVKNILEIKTDPEIGPVNHERLFGFGWFIKCFYQFKLSDLHRKNDGSYCLRMSDESKDWLSSLGKEYVIIIFNTRKFMQRFYTYCDSSGLRNLASPVSYLDDTEYREYSLAFVHEMLNVYAGKDLSQKLISPLLCKRKKYSINQEFRVCVHYDDVNNDLFKEHGPIANLSYQEMEAIQNKATTEKIGSLADISKICTLDEILKLEIPIALGNKGKG